MTTVYLVDDHVIVRSGVRAELSGVPDIDVVGDAGDVDAAVDGIIGTDPDVVLLDVHMPDGGGLTVLRRVTSHSGDRPRFLVLSVSDDPADVIALIRAGARGYVTKSIATEELADAVRRIAGGDAVFSPLLAGYVLDAFTGSTGAEPTPTSHGGGAVVSTDDPSGPDSADREELLDALTAREIEVMRLLARGYTYREMASRLFISVKTVETHVSHVLRKTQQTNRHSLTRWVTDNKLG